MDINPYPSKQEIMKSTLIFLLQIIFVLILLVSFSQCGNRRGPTGGPIDHTLPEILYTDPLEFEQIQNNEIVIAFSKPMDKLSVFNGINVHPATTPKKINWKRNTLHIIFTENLPVNQNVIVFFNQSIKCEHNNFLEKSQIFVFKNGELQKNSLFGQIEFADDYITPGITKITLLDKDSLLVFNDEIANLTYRYDYLNKGKHSLVAYHDLNNTNQYQFGIDPFFKSVFELPLVQPIDISLAVVDTVTPNIIDLETKHHNQIIVEFNKELSKIPEISVINDSTHVLVNILFADIIKNQLYIVMTDLDTTFYTLKVSEIYDKKGNFRSIVEKPFSHRSSFFSPAFQVTDSSPKKGTVVKETTPKISVSFNDLVFQKDIIMSLVEIETGLTIPIEFNNRSGLTINFAPQNKLQEFNSYLLTIHKETVNTGGNSLDNDYLIDFIISM